MNKLQSIDHSLSKNHKTQIVIKHKWSGLLGPTLFFLLLINTAFADLNIAFIDTGFCPTKIKLNKSQSKKITIHSVIDLTGSAKLECSSAKFNKTLPRFHGQLVLEEFLSFFEAKNDQVQIHPLTIFNARGDQLSEYWIKAIDWVKQNKIDLVITAAGLPINSMPATSLSAVWFVPSGRTGPEITKDTKLFPQQLAPLKNLFLIGDYYDGRQVLYDQALLYQDKIDYYFPSGSMRGFKGTSRAVAEAGARALNLCPISSMRDCLKTLSKVYFDNLSKRSIQTY